MRETADFSLEGGEGGTATVALSGPLRVTTVGDLEGRLAAIETPIHRLDLSAVSDIDTTGAWLAHRIARDHQAEIAGASEKARRLIAAVGKSSGAEQDISGRPGSIARAAEWLGNRLIGAGQATYGVIGFLGSMLVALASLVRHPGRFRFNALIHQMELVGVTSLGIIGLMSFLVGVTIAQQGAAQLQAFGAADYTVNLTGKIALRELGILMTAIMVAGRSGSAFAAQIGTMKLTEEVDAMRTIGVSPMEALVIPRVLAAMIMMIPLGFFAALVSIVGGAFISAFTIDIPFLAFLRRIQEVVPITDLWVGLIKAPVFGLIIGVAGCYNGMQVQSNSEEVGLRTTMAVVAALFTVIVLDAFFAVFFFELGWG
jgi:phospholipid/cholesterol/gamma-HCH transport system permease protein